MKNILIIGSGGIQVGNGGEFDSFVVQAIKAFKEEGLKTVLVNPNMASIQTDVGLADEVYFVPLVEEAIEDIIQHEQIDTLALNFGGQVALDLGLRLYNAGKLNGITILGSPLALYKDVTNHKVFYETLDASGVKIIENGEVLRGYKYFGYEVLRDMVGNTTIVSSFECLDPYGKIDGIIVLPAQTINDKNYQTLRNIALKCADVLNIVGSASICIALDSVNHNYKLVSIIPFLSRSSIFIAKATAYPLASIVAKICLGYKLYELNNPAILKTSAFCEAAPDYVVVKIPLDNISLSVEANSKVKSIGIALGIGHSFIEALQKAVQALISGVSGLYDYPLLMPDLGREMEIDSPRRVFALFNWFFDEGSLDEAYALSKIDKWFLLQIKNAAHLAREIYSTKELSNLDEKCLLQAKQSGFSDTAIAKLLKVSENEIRQKRLELNIRPYIKQLDMSGGSAVCAIDCLYLTYNGSAHDVACSPDSLCIIGSGPYYVGSSSEYDWSIINLAKNFKKQKHTIIINSNPESIGTDYNESDRIYFEPLIFERVADILDFENSPKVCTSVGGVIASDLALPLHNAGYTILGTAPIDANTLQSKFISLFYLSGLDSSSHAKKLELDGVAYKGKILIYAISEHVENAQINAGDATLIFPPERLYVKTVLKSKQIADNIVASLDITGPFNLQFIAKNNEIKITECNLRTSRSFPFIAKVTGIDLIAIVAASLLGDPPKATYNTFNTNFVGVRSPVFSYNHYKDSDPVADINMASTGEVAYIGHDILEAFYMSWRSTGQTITGKNILLCLDDKFKEKMLPIVKELFHNGWKFTATEGTHDFLVSHGILSKCVFKVSEQITPNVEDEIVNHHVDLIINLPRDANSVLVKGDGFIIRRLAIDNNIPLITNFQLAEMLLQSLVLYYNQPIVIKSYNQYLQGIN